MSKRPLTGPWTGEPLKEARESLGLSQAELARRLAFEVGCESASPTHVQKWESGTNPGATFLAALARILKVKMEDLCAMPEADRG